jgi:hypothetical protein
MNTKEAKMIRFTFKSLRPFMGALMTTGFLLLFATTGAVAPIDPAFYVLPDL